MQKGGRPVNHRHSQHHSCHDQREQEHGFSCGPPRRRPVLRCRVRAYPAMHAVPMPGLGPDAIRTCTPWTTLSPMFFASSSEPDAGSAILRCTTKTTSKPRAGLSRNPFAPARFHTPHPPTQPRKWQASGFAWDPGPLYRADNGSHIGEVGFDSTVDEGFKMRDAVAQATHARDRTLPDHAPAASNSERPNSEPAPTAIASRHLCGLAA